MDALVAKADSLRPLAKKKSYKSHSSKPAKQNKRDDTHDATLQSVTHSTSLPRSLHATTSAEGSKPSHNHIRDKKLRAQLSRQSTHTLLSKELIADVEDPLFEDATEAAGKIVVENEMERTWRVGQKEIVESVGIEAGRGRKEVKLDGGPYRCRYTRNGRHLAIVGRKGHAATFDALTGTLHSELQLKETCRDITFLQDTSFHAIAQKKYAYIYDRDGVEIHRLKSLIEPTRLEFLPYHWLLVSIGLPGQLNYLDTTTGTIVATHKTHLGPCSTLAQNPQTAVIYLGHNNGTTTLWTPNMSTPVVRLLSHLGPVTGLSVWGGDGAGRYMSTCGADGRVKVWDCRNWKGALREWTVRSGSGGSGVECEWSQRGHLAVSAGGHVNIYTPPSIFTASTKQSPPPLYLTHPLPPSSYSPLAQPRFTPFFDTLTIPHNAGYSTILVPGSAENKWDSFEADPYENIKARREREVRGLLDKIKPDLITLDPSFLGRIAEVDPSHSQSRAGLPYSRLPRVERLKISGKAEEMEELDDVVDSAPGDENEGEQKQGDGPGSKILSKKKESKKMRGKNKSLKRHLRKKRKNIIDPTTIAIRAKLEKQRALVKSKKSTKESNIITGGQSSRKSALDRFRR